MQKKKYIFKLAAKIHAVALGAVFLFYILLGVFGDPSLILSDAKAKYAWAATKLSVYVMGVPDKPEVNAQTGCNNNLPYIDLNWNFTEATTSYTIHRNGNLLSQGLINRNWRDNLVENQTLYSYTVTAIGPFASVSSDLITITSALCDYEPPKPINPEAEILTFDERNIHTYAGDIATKNKNPSISGTSNLPNADLEITLSGPTNIFSTGKANENGFWSWSPPINLFTGEYFFSIKIAEPLNNTNFISKNLNFKILSDTEEAPPPPPPIKKDDDDDKDEETAQVTICHNNNTITVAKKFLNAHLAHGDTRGICADAGLTEKTPSEVNNVPGNESQEQPEEQEKYSPSFSIKVIVNNSEKIVYQGRILEISVLIDSFNKTTQETILEYQIVNESGEVVYIISENVFIAKSAFEKEIYIPQSLTTGNYFIRILMKNGGEAISGEDSFKLEFIPLISLGSNIKITYQDLVNKTGWLLLVLFASFMIIFTMFSIEHRLANRALFHLTGQEFLTSGIINNKRKGDDE